MVVLLFLVISYLLFCITLKPLFEKAGIEGRKALIPGVNFVEAFKMVGDSSNRVWWLLFPVYNIFVYVGLCIDIVRSFGKYKFSDSAIAFIYAPIIFFNIGKTNCKKLSIRTQYSTAEPYRTIFIIMNSLSLWLTHIV